MKKEHEDHLAGIKAAFILDLDPKYRAGQRQHRGRLWEEGLVFAAAEARNEAVDQVVYTHDVKTGVRKIREIVVEALEYGVLDPVLHGYFSDILVLLDGVKSTPQDQPNRPGRQPGPTKEKTRIKHG